MKLQNPSASSLQSLVNSISSLAVAPSSLTMETKLLMVSLISKVIMTAVAMEVSSSELTGLEQVISMAMTAAGGVPSSSSDILSTLLSSYSDFILSDMVEGQRPSEMITPTFSTSSRIISSHSGGAISTATSELELIGAKPLQLISLPSSMVYPLHLSLIRTQPQSYLPGTPSWSLNQLTEPFGALFSKYPCSTAIDSSPCSFLVELPNMDTLAVSLEESQENPPYFNVTCVMGVEVLHQYLCPRDYWLNVTCNGTVAGTITNRCPRYVKTARCNSISSETLFTVVSCKLGQYSPQSTTCNCTIESRSLTSHLGTRSHRDLQADDEVPADSGPVQCSLLAMQESVAVNFLSTWSTADDLSASTVADTWTVLVTLGSLVVTFIVFMVLASSADQHESNMTGVLNKPNKREPRKRLQRRLSVGSALVQREFDRIEQSLPAVFRSDSVWEKSIREMKVYHRWLGVVFFYSPTFTRSLRLLSLGSSIIIMLFIQVSDLPWIDRVYVSNTFSFSVVPNLQSC
jgi:hypothetical protein